MKEKIRQRLLNAVKFASIFAFIFSFAVWHWAMSSTHSMMAISGMDQDEYFRCIADAHLFAYRSLLFSIMGLLIYGALFMLKSRSE